MPMVSGIKRGSNANNMTSRDPRLKPFARGPSVPAPKTPTPAPAKKEERLPPESTTTGTISEGSDQVSPMFQGMQTGESIWSKYGLKPTAEQFSGIMGRYQSALQGYNAPELAAQRQQMAEEVGAQTSAAQRQLRAMQGQQGIRGAAAQAGMMQLAQQGQKAVAGSERDLLIRNQQVMQSALDRYNQFMQGERGGLLSGMLQFGDMAQQRAADAEMRGLLQQYLSQAQAAANAAVPGGGSQPWWMQMVQGRVPGQGNNVMENLQKVFPWSPAGVADRWGGGPVSTNLDRLGI